MLHTETHANDGSFTPVVTTTNMNPTMVPLSWYQLQLTQTTLTHFNLKLLAQILFGSVCSELKCGLMWNLNVGMPH